jgi:hypothetical protein
MTTNRTRRDFTLTWTLDSPPAEVFRAWTDPDHLDWFYDDNNPIPSEPIELDLRVGGVWRQLPAHLSADRVQEWWSMGIRDGWRDTVDRLAAGLARTPSAI